jgi:hypothetical protein
MGGGNQLLEQQMETEEEGEGHNPIPIHKNKEDSELILGDELNTINNCSMCLFLFYSSHQLSELENLFIRNKYPDVGNRAEISRAIGLAEQCIRVRRDPPNR